MVGLFSQFIPFDRIKELQLVNDCFTQQLQVYAFVFRLDALGKVVLDHCVVDSDLRVLAYQGLNSFLIEVALIVLPHKKVVKPVLDHFHFFCRFKSFSDLAIESLLELRATINIGFFLQKHLDIKNVMINVGSCWMS